jgi:ribosomal protein L11 methyltransferase
MSLRLLEEVTRGWRPGWAMIDLGTGSGILALAAKCFGARRVLGIDNDPTAISTANANARLNKIDNIDFEMGDVLRIKGRDDKFDVIAANLFSELIIKALPAWKTRLNRHGWLILSGILREQENELKRALRRNKIDIVEVRRHGKWIAIAATLS